MKKKIRVQQIVVAMVGIFFVSVGVAFNNCAGWGNDAIGMLYDGIRVAFGMTSEQLGMASNVVNIGLTVILFLVARRYVSIGTFVYLLPYGFFVNVGTMLYSMIFASDMAWVRVLGSVAGCVMLCFGVAIYIVLDIGVDPFTGIVLFFADVVKKQYGSIKVIFDITLIVIGALLGGKLGVVTLITAIAVGPTIQLFAGLLLKWRWFMVCIKGEN